LTVIVAVFAVALSGSGATRSYDHTATDSVDNVAESINLATDPAHQNTVAHLSAMLKAGWRAVRPTSMPTPL